MWFDSHCHLHLCEVSPEEILDEATAAGVDQMLTVGIDAASNQVAVELAQDERVFAAVGIHPNSADEWNTEARAQLEQLLASGRVVAVGESGLDFYRDYVPAADQEVAFGAHIELAKGHDKALVIHTRSSIDAALDQLEAAEPPSRYVFHCWSGDEVQLRRALELGAFISFAGNVSFKNAQNLRDAARLVPSDRLLVETDSPYLSPVPFRGKPNRPARVVLVGEAVAVARSEEVDMVAERTSANARRLFGLE